MKLRNKKTGEIITKIDISQDKESIWVLENEPRIYRSLAELNKEWEDYEEKEPLIKDKKIRKAVKAWAEANGYSEGIYFTNFEADNTCYFLNDVYDDKQIWFNKCLPDIKGDEVYTIAELCGEEEDEK